MLRYVCLIDVVRRGEALSKGLIYIVCIGVFIGSMLLTGELSARQFYVAVGGTDQLSEDVTAPGNLMFAVLNAQAADTVWIKAGQYGAVNLVFRRSGLPGSPISFFGYRNTPGDLDSLDVPTEVSAYWSGNYHGAETLFPTLDGGNRATAGLAMQLYGRHYIAVRNLQITRYNNGIGTWNSSHVHFENLLITMIGDRDQSYDGIALSISNTSNSSAQYCFVYNAAAEGISVVSSGAAPASYNRIRKCTVVCDDTLPAKNLYGPGTDYYIVLGTTGNYNAEYNVVEECSIERIGNIGHGGHGYTVVNYDNDTANARGKTRYNIIRNCTSKAIRSLYHLRGEEVEFNYFSNCTSTSGYSEPGSIALTCSRYNTFDNISITIHPDDATNPYYYYPVVFYKSTAYSPGYSRTASGNIFSNCVFQAPGGIGFGYYVDGTASYSADSNMFINCTFVNPNPAVGSGFLSVQRRNYSTFVWNCIISGFQQYQSGESTARAAISYENCCFHNNGFAQHDMVDATLRNCLFTDPQFEDPDIGNYRLLPLSPCIDAGLTVDLTSDAAGNPRPCNNRYDIGAYEYQGNCASTFVQPPATGGKNRVRAISSTPSATYTIVGELADAYTIEVYSLSGECVARVHDTNVLDVRNLARGLYLIVAKDSRSVATFSIVKD